MSDRIEKLVIAQWAVALVLVLAAGVLYVRRPAPSPTTVAATVSASLLEQRGVLLPGGPDTVLVFTDFLCPYCQRLATELADLEGRHPTVSIRFYPVRGRESVFAAALATCAEDQGFLRTAHDLLFALDSIPDIDGLVEHIPAIDAATFQECVYAQETLDRLQRDLDNANMAGVRGTPTALVDGMLLQGVSPILQVVVGGDH